MTAGNYLCRMNNDYDFCYERTDERTSDYYHSSGKPAKDSDADTDADALMWVDGRRNNDDDEQSQLWLLLLDVEIIKTH